LLRWLAAGTAGPTPVQGCTGQARASSSSAGGVHDLEGLAPCGGGTRNGLQQRPEEGRRPEARGGSTPPSRRSPRHGRGPHPTDHGGVCPRTYRHRGEAWMAMRPLLTEVAVQSGSGGGEFGHSRPPPTRSDRRPRSWSRARSTFFKTAATARRAGRMHNRSAIRDFDKGRGLGWLIPPRHAGNAAYFTAVFFRPEKEKSSESSSEGRLMGNGKLLSGPRFVPARSTVGPPGKTAGPNHRGPPCHKLSPIASSIVAAKGRVEGGWGSRMEKSEVWPPLTTRPSAGERESARSVC